MASPRKHAFLWMIVVISALLGVSMMLSPTSGVVYAAQDAPSARASHILVTTEAECDELLKQLDEAENLEAKFAELAENKSKCPSGRRGGDLGEFGRHQMVPEFDQVVFEKEVGIVHKVRTQFGWHLVLTTERNGMGVLDEKDDL